LKKISLLLTVLLALSLLLSACKSSAKEDAKSKDAATVLTQAAVTAEAIMRTMAASSPTPRPVTPTPITPTATATIATSPTALPGVPTEPGGGPAPTVGEKIEFVADLTVPDGTVFAPNATFVKTWRLKNVGTTTWTPSYTAVFISGDQMGAPVSLALPTSVAPGQTVDISIPMTAPATENTYTANFLLANASGQRFGLDPRAAQPFYVVIVVDRKEGTPAASPTPATPTIGPSITPGAGGNIVNWVFLSVDNASANTCPHTFNFTGRVTLNNPTTLTYRLEFISSNASQPGPVLNPETVALAAGEHVLSFPVVSFTSSFNGVARLHVTAPEDIYSNPVNLVLSCPTPVVYPTP
jgi:hypothetical protein